MKYIKEIEFQDNENLKDYTEKYEKVLVVFTGKRCVACRVYDPVINEAMFQLNEQLTEQNAEWVEKDIIQKIFIDVESNMRTVEEYDITSRPFTMIFSRGKLVFTASGVESHLKENCINAWNLSTIPSH